MDTHVKNLQASMELFPDLYLHPIIVNEKLEIIDGQHRFTAAKNLGQEIFYIIDKNPASQKIIAYNTTQKNWKLEDYLNYWCNKSNENYLKLEAFCKEYNLDIPIGICWITGRIKYGNHSFKNGKFVFELHEHTKKAVETLMLVIEILKDRVPNYKTMVRQPCFNDAIKRFLETDRVNHAIFLSQLKKYSMDFYFYRNTEQYLEKFVETYNYNRSNDRLFVAKDGLRLRII